MTSTIKPSNYDTKTSNYDIKPNNSDTKLSYTATKQSNSDTNGSAIKQSDTAAKQGEAAAKQGEATAVQRDSAAKQRDTTLDALKALAIFFVCFGHSLQYFLDLPFKENPVWLFIYSFHMPLFMSLVGYFSVSLLDLSFKKLFTKRFRQLIVPALTFSTFFVLISWIFYSKPQNYITNLVFHLVFDFWFLKSAFVCTLLFYAAAKVEKWRSVGLVISLIVSQCLHFELVNFMYPCFLVGYLLRTRKEQFTRHPIAWLLASAAVYAAVYPFYDGRAWASNFDFSLLGPFDLWK